MPLEKIVNGVASWNGEVVGVKKDWLTQDLVAAFGPWGGYLDDLARWVASGRKTVETAANDWASYVWAVQAAQESGKTVGEAPQSYPGANPDPLEVLAAKSSILSHSRGLLSSAETVGVMTVATALNLRECQLNIDELVARIHPNIEVDSKDIQVNMGKDTIAPEAVTAPTMATPVLKLNSEETNLLHLCLDVQEGHLSLVDAACWWLSEIRAEYKPKHGKAVEGKPQCQATWWALHDLRPASPDGREKLSVLPGLGGMDTFGTLNESVIQRLGYLSMEMSQGNITLTEAMDMLSRKVEVTRNFVLHLDQFGSHQVHCWLRILGASICGFDGLPAVGKDVLLAGMLAYQAELRMRAAHAIVLGGAHGREDRRREVTSKLIRGVRLPEAPEYTDDIGVVWEYLNLCSLDEGKITFEDLHEVYPWTSPGCLYDALRRVTESGLTLDDDVKTTLTQSLEQGNPHLVTRHAEVVNTSRKPWVGGRLLDADEANTLWNLAAALAQGDPAWTVVTARARFVDVLLGIGEPYMAHHELPEQGAMERSWADLLNSEVVTGILGRFDYHTLMDLFYARKGRLVKKASSSVAGTVNKEDVVALALLVAQGRLTPDRALELWNSPDAMISWLKTTTAFRASVAQETENISRDMARHVELKGKDFGMKFVRVWNWLTDENRKGETWNVDQDLAEFVHPDVLVQCTNDESNLLDLFSMALSKSVLQKETPFSTARNLWGSRFDLSDDWMEKFVKNLKEDDGDNADLLKEMLTFASCLRNPTSFLDLGPFSDEATIEGLFRYLRDLDAVSASEDKVMSEVARWLPDSVALALNRFPPGDWRVTQFRTLPGVSEHLQAPVKQDLRDALSPSMQTALTLAFQCSLGSLTVTEAAQDLAAFVRYGAIPKDPVGLIVNKIPTDESLREIMANILTHPLMTSLDAVGTHHPRPRLHEFDVYVAQMNEQAMKSDPTLGVPHASREAPTKGQIAIETIKADAREIALRTGVRRVRAAIADKFSAWWSRQNQPRAAGEGEDAYRRRLEAGNTQARAFLGTDMGEASLAMLAGFVWTVVGEDVSNDQVRSFGDAVAREMRVSAGADMLDAVLTEVLRPTMAEIQAILPSTGIRVHTTTAEADEDDRDHRAAESLTRRA